MQQRMMSSDRSFQRPWWLQLQLLMCVVLLSVLTGTRSVSLGVADVLRVVDRVVQEMISGDKMGRTLAGLTVWCLWKQRKTVIFRDRWRSAQALLKENKESSFYWYLVGGETPKPLMVAQLASE
jgi:hypothetical protein